MSSPATTQLFDGLVVPNSEAGDIAFENGLNPDGTLNAANYWDWTGTTPATYSALRSTVHKWGSTTVGTPSGAITYAFDAGSNWTAAQQQGLVSAMQLWSDESNTTFTQVAPGQTPDFTFVRSMSGESGSTINFTNGVVGTTTAGQSSSGSVSLFTADYGEPNDFSQFGGYGITSAVHELGHVLGLGHAGPYNGSVQSSTQQNGPYDTRLYSIMSYIDPFDTSAKYYSQYPVTGTDWIPPNGGYPRESYSPMIDDILAVQQLYGAPTTGALTQTQTFGFHTTITDATSEVFNFNVDQTPNVTLFDTAPNNTLDLSGFTTANTVNLNQGTFSSVAGLTNNVAIAFGTHIDTYVGDGANDTVTANTDPDVIDGGGGINTVVMAGSRAQYSVIGSGTGEVQVLGDGQKVSLTNVQQVQFSDGSQINITPQTVIAPQAVDRFYDTTDGAHFFTSNPSEVKSLQSSPNFILEGVGFNAENPAGDPAAVAVYRFYQPDNGAHFYTDSMTEMQQIQASHSGLTLEGVAFYVDPVMQAGDVPVYRFYETQSDTHLYTDDASEAASIRATRPDMPYEGVAFYVKA